MHFLRALMAVALLSLASCSSSEAETPEKAVKAIIGATLIDGSGRPPIPNSVVLIENDKISAATSGKDFKIPDNAQRTNAYGMYVTPTQMGARLEPGVPANLYLVQSNPLDNPLVLSNPSRVMKTGEWLDAGKK